MKKQGPLILGFLVGLIAVAEFYVPARGMHTTQSFLLETAQVLAAMAYILGGINVVQVNLPIITRRRPDWEYKLVLLGAAVIMAFAGIRWQTLGGEPTAGTLSIDHGDVGTSAEAKALLIVDANQARYAVSVDGGEAVAGTPFGGILEPGDHTVVVRSPEPGYSEYTVAFKAIPGDTVSVRANLRMLWGPNGRVHAWIYDHVFAPANATMFALLAFFIASAAFRAFRARNVEAALLLAAAIMVMIGVVPLGRAISSVFPDVSDWIIEYLNNAGRRAIIMGAALGAIGTSLRVILGLERSHLGRE